MAYRKKSGPGVFSALIAIWREPAFGQSFYRIDNVDAVGHIFVRWTAGDLVKSTYSSTLEFGLPVYSI